MSDIYAIGVRWLAQNREQRAGAILFSFDRRGVDVERVCGQRFFQK